MAPPVLVLPAIEEVPAVDDEVPAVDDDVPPVALPVPPLDDDVPPVDVEPAAFAGGLLLLEQASSPAAHAMRANPTNPTLEATFRNMDEPPAFAALHAKKQS